MQIPKTDQTISGDYVSVLRLTYSLYTTILFVTLLCLIFCSWIFFWPLWIQISVGCLLSLIIGWFVWVFFFYAKIRPEFTFYGMDEFFVRLKIGKFFKKDIVIPMQNIQYIGVEQGPFLRKYELYEVTFGTLRSHYSIPGLDKKEASNIQEWIMNYAKIDEDELEYE